MEKVEVNEKACCQEKERTLNKLSSQETSVIKGVSEWIRWTKSKRICQECKDFRADSLNAIDKTTAEVDKDTYLKKYFTV